MCCGAAWYHAWMHHAAVCHSIPHHAAYINILLVQHARQEGLAVASIARDDPSTLPGDDPFSRSHMTAIAMRSKLGSEFET